MRRRPAKICRLTPLLFEGGPDERYEFALEVIIRGLASVANDMRSPGS